MWSLRRPAVLQQLSRARSLVHEPLLRSNVPPVALQAWANARFFASDSVGGVEMSHLLRSSPSQLKSELGRTKMMELHRALSKEFTDVVGKEEVTFDDLQALFFAADKTRLDSLLLHSFEHMKTRFPDQINYTMYGTLYRMLARVRDGEKLYQVYEFARPLHPNPSPEIIYRFGIVGRLEQDDLAGAQELLEDMEENDVDVSNEIYSRVLMAHARGGNVGMVGEIYDKLNPQEGVWHETSIDRVLLSLGIVGKPELAFDFYVNANMKLSGSTLITLLSVCRHNECKQQAADILQNRKRFNLKLDARGYNGILETLEFLDKHDELEAVLEEMTNVGVSFDTRTRAIVARNHDVLKNTYFGHESHQQHNQRRRRDNTRVFDSHNAFSVTSDLIKLLQGKKIDEAVEFVSHHVRPFTVDDVLPSGGASPHDVTIPEGALFVTPSISKLVVSVYIAAGDDATVAKLLDGLALRGGNIRLPLKEIVDQYTRGLKEGGKAIDAAQEKRYEVAYRAAKLLLTHRPVSATSDASMRLFSLHKDTDSARTLCECVVQEFKSPPSPAKEESNSRDRNRLTSMDIAELVGKTIRVLVSNNKITETLDMIANIGEHGWKIESGAYFALLRAMRAHTAYDVRPKGVVVLAENYSAKPFFYLSDDFERVLDDMEKHNVPMTRAILSNVIVGLAGGELRQRLRLLEAYPVALESKDKFVLPFSAYSVLLQVAYRESSEVETVKQIYQDAIASITPVDGSALARVPLDWEIVLISHLAKSGLLDEAVERLLNMQELCGSYSYEATVMTLRGALAAKHVRACEKVTALLQQREFKPTLIDSYDIVHLAKEAELSWVAFDVLDLYEKAHGRETDDAVDHSRSHQSVRDKFAVKKIRSMYRVALMLCEQKSDWKRALTLSTRVNELLRFETEEETKAGDYQQ